MVPGEDTACMKFWALLAKGQLTLRKVAGGQTLPVQPNALDLAT